jgi:hypothetical protein
MEVLLSRALKELHCVPSPPMGERVRVRGKAITLPLPAIIIFFVRIRGIRA